MEQALVFISIVLGVAVALELENLDRVLRSKRVKWHWAQPAYALFVLLSIIAFWWQVAAKPEGQISFAQFLPIMFQLVTFVLASAVSLPRMDGDEEVNLADYYQEHRRYQWLLIVLNFWTVYISYVLWSWSQAEDWSQFLNAIAFDTIGALVIMGMMFAKPWWLVGAGFALVSLAPLAWAVRTL